MYNRKREITFDKFFLDLKKQQQQQQQNRDVYRSKQQIDRPRGSVSYTVL